MVLGSWDVSDGWRGWDLSGDVSLDEKVVWNGVNQVMRKSWEMSNSGGL